MGMNLVLSFIRLIILADKFYWLKLMRFSGVLPLNH